MPDQSASDVRTACTTRTLANPRRLRLGRDGLPLPVPAAQDERRAA